MIVNQDTGRSKGYAFFEFTNYKEFNEALGLQGTLTFGKQLLVLNSAKNKYEYNEEEKINELNKINAMHNISRNNNEEMKSLNCSMISNLTQPISTAETGISSIRNSKEYFNTCNNDNINNNYNLGEKTKFDMDNININTSDIWDNLNLQIEDSLKKLSEQYYQYDNQPSLFNYYCSPFIYNRQNRKDFYFVNKDEENFNSNNNDNYCIKCPFESCNEKLKQDKI